MKLAEIKNKINTSPTLKSLLLSMICQRNGARPRLWIRIFVQPFTIKRGRGSRIRGSVRRDIFPFNRFELGRHSYVESFSVLNNGVGDVVIGDFTRVGIGNTVIGPVEIGNRVIIGQNVVFSGLNHGYEDVTMPIADQDVTVHPIRIGDETWIGAGSVVVAGVTIGRHCVVGGGSVVTRDIPDYTVVAGNPARIIKQFDANTGKWIKKV